MRSKITGTASRTIVASVLALSLGTSAAGRLASADRSIILTKPFTIVSADRMPPVLSDKLDRLARIDPDHPVKPDGDSQTLSLFGREDLIAASSKDYKPTGCTPFASGTDVLAEIERMARRTSIVIVNESHEQSVTREFAADVARRLRPLGYDTLAMETLSNPPLDVPARYLPTFLKQPQLPYLSDDDGHYLSEAGYGRLGRQAKALGYGLLRYEYNGYGGSNEQVSISEQIARREEGQASNLAAFLKAHPATKLLVYVGYSHAIEVPDPDGTKWMAARLKDKTGIDPLTISQTTCRGGSDAPRLAIPPSDVPAGAFDLVVDHPIERFTRGRPAWRKAKGDRVVAIPKGLRPLSGWRVIEARPVGEPDTSVPLDRVAIRPGDDTALMLPPGRYSVRVIEVRPIKDAPVQK